MALLMGLALLSPALASGAGTWSSTGAMHTAHDDHTATLLGDGRLLIAGGYDGTNSLSDALLYDPTRATWSGAASLPSARDSQTATLLADGSVLVAGGELSANSAVSSYLASAARYQP
jgi:hypothetical protein